MRCLYCGKELALLKRLTGGGEFCSDTHKQSYQEEYNRLALSRLLQAQTKGADAKKAAEGKPAKNAPATKTPAPVAAPVAVEEPVEAAPKPVVERPRERVVERVQEKVEQPVAPRAAARERRPVEPPPEPPPQTFTPPDVAGFSWPKPEIATMPPGSLYVEPWLDCASAPSTPEWQFHDGTFTLALAQLLPLEIHPTVWKKEITLRTFEATPQDFGSGTVNLDVPFRVEPESQPEHAFGSAGPLELEVQPIAAEALAARSSDPLGFQWEVVYASSPLFELAQTGIGFSAEGNPEQQPEAPAEPVVSIVEEAPVVEAAPVIEEPVPAVEAPAPVIEEPAPVLETKPPEPPAPAEAVAEVEEASPRAALEALSRLHHDLVEHEEAPAPPAAVEPPRTKKKVVEPAPEPVKIPETAAAPEPEAFGFVEMPLKTFAPAKPTVMINAKPLVNASEPVLPRLKALPLRPKMGMAPPGFTHQPPARSTTTTAASSSPSPSRSPLTEAKLKSAPGPARPDVQRKPLPKPKIETKAVEPEETRPAPVVEERKPETPPKVEPAPTTRVKPVEPARSRPAAATSRPVEAEEPAAPPKSMREPVRPTPPRREEPKPKPAAPPPPAQTMPGEPTLTFESLQLQLMANSKPPFWGSLKVKLGLAIVLVAAVGVGYLGWGRSHKPAPTANVSADGSGPSIMVGEGGWVQDWAGDPVGSHGGRQVTIYRPSLKLSDYRVEFQGQIESKSLGWVFRAADPDNYYAMKLEQVSSGVPHQVALIKYMILHGRETELGRIPVDVPVTSDTVYSVRMDVRGPRFNTYIQGQQVDVWTNDQLKTGGVGFLNERSERGKVKTVSISYLNGAEK